VNGLLGGIYTLLVRPYLLFAWPYAQPRLKIWTGPHVKVDASPVPFSPPFIPSVLPDDIAPYTTVPPVHSLLLFFLLPVSQDLGRPCTSNREQRGSPSSIHTSPEDKNFCKTFLFHM